MRGALIPTRYFVHGDNYAGISAFINKPDAKLDCNALMLTAGASILLSQGRLKNSWKHAFGLKELAKYLSRFLVAGQA